VQESASHTGLLDIGWRRHHSGDTPRHLPIEPVQARRPQSRPRLARRDGPAGSFDPYAIVISLLSLRFLLLAVVAIVATSRLTGALRQLAFLGLNLVFVWLMVLGTGPTVVILGLSVLGYALAQWCTGQGSSRLLIGISVLTALFVYLRGYGLLEWVLPHSLLLRLASTVGLSFLFFKIVHVLADARSGTLGRLDLLTFLNYCLGFTTFMMGPIQRYQDFRAQWDGTQLAAPLELEPHLDAVIRMLVGFVKAYVLAVFFQQLALRPDTDLLSLSLGDLLIQVYAFWFYLYLNFSGYCDVVIGAGTLLGVRPPENFDRPFLARNISDFWLRQHRSLTLWLTDYVFSPLYKKLLTAPATRRHKLFAANLALMATMMVSGIWHGTTFAFFLFGLVHGLWFVIYRSWEALLTRALGRAGVRRLHGMTWARVTGVALTFNATAFAFVFFQVSSASLLRTWHHLVAG